MYSITLYRRNGHCGAQGTSGLLGQRCLPLDVVRSTATGLNVKLEDSKRFKYSLPNWIITDKLHSNSPNHEMYD
jgi:hypothetical protein